MEEQANCFLSAFQNLYKNVLEDFKKEVIKEKRDFKNFFERHVVTNNLSTFLDSFNRFTEDIEILTLPFFKTEIISLTKEFFSLTYQQDHSISWLKRFLNLTDEVVLRTLVQNVGTIKELESIVNSAKQLIPIFETAENNVDSDIKETALHLKDYEIFYNKIHSQNLYEKKKEELLKFTCTTCLVRGTCATSYPPKQEWHHSTL